MAQRITIDKDYVLNSVTIDTIGWCWNWSRTKLNGKGYAIITSSPKAIKMHRKSYELFKGSIPDNMTIDHLCRNKGCINPDHLEVVTQAENARRHATVFKTHCKRGHEFTPENTIKYVNKFGINARMCITCRRLTQTMRRNANIVESRAKERERYKKYNMVEYAREYQRARRAAKRLGEPPHGL